MLAKMIYACIASGTIGLLVGFLVGERLGWRRSWTIHEFYDKRTQWEASRAGEV